MTTMTQEWPAVTLRLSLADRAGFFEYGSSQGRTDDLRALSGRVEDGPGRVLEAPSRGLTLDRLRRSEGCREGYPPRPTPSHWIQPVSGAQPQRRVCPKDHARSLLIQQGYVCVYCAEPFGSVVKRGKLSVTSVNYDHAIPLAYLNANPRWNWVAACNICNQLKGSKLFDSIQAIRMYVLEIRERKHTTVWTPPVSCEEDPARWAQGFAKFLCTIDYRSQRDLQKSARTPLGDALAQIESTFAWGDTAADYEPDPDGLVYPRLTRGPWPWSKQVSA